MDREDQRGETVHSAGGGARKIDIPGRTRDHRLSGDDLRTLRTVSVFRTVDARDIPSSQVKYLIASGLVEKHVMHVGGQESRGAKKSGKGREERSRLEVLTATREGRDLLETLRPLDDLQRLHCGLVKRNELEHDAALYPAYLEQARNIEHAGGRVTRVVLDYEFKALVNRVMNRKDGPAPERRREILAQDLELEIVDGKLPLPDLRIEYVDEHGIEKHRDVEVTTRHYRGSHLAGKAKSGFAMVSAEKIGVIRDRAGGVPSDDHRSRLFQ